LKEKKGPCFVDGASSCKQSKDLPYFVDGTSICKQSKDRDKCLYKINMYEINMVGRRVITVNIL
jgi:hypothetical protein